MSRTPAWMRPVTCAAWLVAEALRTTASPAGAVRLRDIGIAMHSGRRHWPVIAAWGLGCTPRPDAAATQQTADGCGAAALAAILQAHGRPVRQSLLWSLTRLPGGGTSAARLASIGSRFGLECTVRCLDFEVPDLPRAAPCVLPAVVHLRRGHFVVLRQWSAASASVFDPACGGVGVRRDVLARQASGFVITCAPRRDGTDANRSGSPRESTTARVGGEP